jgi:PRC-barrel domain protein
VSTLPPTDDGHAVHYTALERGTPVFSSDDEEVGRVAEVLDNHREHIFDGLVIDTSGGGRRFVDAPEVARTAERAVTLTITAAEVAELPPPPSRGPDVGGGVRRLFGGLRRR